MSEKFDPLSFHRAEREINDEMTKRYPAHWEEIEGRKTEVVEFPNFKIYSQQEVGKPTKLLSIIVGEKMFNLLKDLPSDHKLFLTFYPSGSYKHKKKELHIPRITSRGALLSMLHEFQHLLRRVNLSEKEIKDLNMARTKQNKQPESITQTEKDVILLDERFAWNGAKIKANEIETALSIKIFQDQESLDNYIQRRLETYEKFL